MAAPTYVASSSATQLASASASIAITYPVGSAAGDLLVMSVTFRSLRSLSTLTVTTPSGWTLLSTQDNISSVWNLTVIYWRIRGAETSATVTSSVATDMYSVGQMHAFRGGGRVDNTAVGYNNTASTAAGTPAVAVAAAEAALLLMTTSYNQSTTAAYTHTWASPTVEKLDTGAAWSTGQTYCAVSAAVDTLATPGTYPAVSSTTSVQTGSHYSSSIAIAPVLTAAATTTATATLTATASVWRPAAAGTTVTATTTGNAHRDTSAATDTTAVTATATGALVRATTGQAAPVIVAGLAAAAIMDAAAGSALTVSAGLSATVAVGPIAAEPTVAAATLTASVERVTPVATTTGVIATVSAEVERLSGAAGAVDVTVELTAAAVVGKQISADLVVIVSRSGRFATPAGGENTQATATLTVGAVTTPDGVLTSNGALDVQAGLTGAAARNTRAAGPLEVTADVDAVMSAGMNIAGTRTVTAHLFASAWILGQPVPHTPQERTVTVRAEDRSLSITREDRSVSARAEDRDLDILPA